MKDFKELQKTFRKFFAAHKGLRGDLEVVKRALVIYQKYSITDNWSGLMPSEIKEEFERIRQNYLKGFYPETRPRFKMPYKEMYELKYHTMFTDLKHFIDFMTTGAENHSVYSHYAFKYGMSLLGQHYYAKPPKKITECAPMGCDHLKTDELIAMRHQINLDYESLRPQMVSNLLATNEYLVFLDDVAELIGSAKLKI